MKFWLPHPKKAALFFFLVLLPLLIAELDLRTSIPPFSHITQGLQKGFYTLSDNVSFALDKYINIIRTRNHNQELEIENAQLRTEIMALQELHYENDRLRHLLNFKKRQIFKIMPTKIVGYSSHPNYETLTIDRGTQHGVKKYMGVISPDGVIGYIAEVYPSTSRVLPLTDRYSVVRVSIQRNRTAGLLEGVANNRMRFNDYDTETDPDIKLGDRVLTNSFSDSFPTGLPVGQVSQITKRPHGKPIIDVKPFARALNKEHLFVVFSKALATPPPSTEDDE